MNLGAGEVLLLMIFALILFGPNKLPEVARQVGRALAEIRKMSRQFEEEVREVTEPITREFRDATMPIEESARDDEARSKQTYALDDDFSSFATPADPEED